MKLLISPGKGVGAIEFGMSQTQVHDLFNVKLEPFKRNKLCTEPCDYYRDLGLFVYYSAEGIVEAVEFGLSSCPPVFEGINLLSLSFDSAQKQLLQFDKNLVSTNSDLISFKLGIGAWAPTAKEEPHLPIQSVIVFDEGYYD